MAIRAGANAVLTAMDGTELEPPPNVRELAPAGGAGFFDTVSFDVAPVPVPAAVWLFGSGLLGLVGVARRRKS
jgi:hypothetical protein